MKVTELYDMYKENGNIKDVFENGLLTVKKYVPIFTKQTEIDTVLEIIINEEESGLAYVNSMDEAVSYVLSASALYIEGLEYDVEVDGDELADMLLEMDISDMIATYTEDARTYKEMFDESIRTKLALSNSIGAVMNKHLTQLNEKLGGAIDKITNFDMSPEKMGEITSLLSHMNDTVKEVKAVANK